MFTPTRREAVRDDLVAFAHDDPSISGLALVGSAATDRQDAWSDIDLVLQLAPDADEPEVVARWSDRLRSRHGAVDELDVIAAGGIRYRVFLLASTLQVDVSFWPHDEFRATGPGFALVFGSANPASAPPAADPRRGVGTAWLYGLHARSAIERGRTWQAVLMLDGLRDQLVPLMCLRHELPPHDGRGVDHLPSAALAGLADARASTLDDRELRRSLRALLGLLLVEVTSIDAALAARLDVPFQLLAGSVAER